MLESQKILDKILSECEVIRKRIPKMREGQIFFNACFHVNKTLAIRILGSPIDPFYNDKNIEKCKKFILKEYLADEEKMINPIETMNEIERLQGLVEDANLERNDAIEYRSYLIAEIFKLQSENSFIKHTSTFDKAAYESRIATLLSDLEVTKTNNKNFLEFIKQADKTIADAKQVISDLRQKEVTQEHLARKVVLLLEENKSLKEQKEQSENKDIQIKKLSLDHDNLKSAYEILLNSSKNTENKCQIYYIALDSIASNALSWPWEKVRIARAALLKAIEKT